MKMWITPGHSLHDRKGWEELVSPLDIVDVLHAKATAWQTSAYLIFQDDDRRSPMPVYSCSWNRRHIQRRNQAVSVSLQCEHCNETWIDHGPNSKCLFEPTHYTYRVVPPYGEDPPAVPCDE